MLNVNANTNVNTNINNSTSSQNSIVYNFRSSSQIEEYNPELSLISNFSKRKKPLYLKMEEKYYSK